MPVVLLVTSTLIVQLEGEGMVPAPRTPSTKVMVPPPSGAVRVPPQVLVTLAGVAIVTPAGAGSVSVKARSLRAVAVLVMTNWRVLTLPGPIVSGLKVLSNVTEGASVACADTTTASASRAWKSQSLNETSVEFFFTVKTSRELNRPCDTTALSTNQGTLLRNSGA